MVNKNNKKAKLDDVARVAGVSKTTVSRVLNKRGYLSEQTIARVHEAMEKLHYRPNAVARQLYNQNTGLIGLIFPTVNNPFFAQLEARLENELYEHGYKVLVGNSQNNPQKEADYLEQLLSHQIDGLIVGAHNIGIEEYQHTNLPVVAIDQIVNTDVPVVSSDNLQGGRLATELLIDDGCRFIVHTNGPEKLETPAHNREIGYKQAMTEAGMTPHIMRFDFSLSADEKSDEFEQLFETYPQVDGIFAGNDTDAAMLVAVAAKCGKRVPQDLKIVGYDGADMTRLLYPDLTTIQQPINQMAATAVRLLKQRLKGQKADSIVLPVDLVRGTTA